MLRTQLEWACLLYGCNSMEPKPLRSFARGLAGLSVLNRHGSATALTLARETGVPRLTVYPLLQTLMDGFIPLDTRELGHSYRLAQLLIERCVSASQLPSLAFYCFDGGLRSSRTACA